MAGNPEFIFFFILLTTVIWGTWLWSPEDCPQSPVLQWAPSHSLWQNEVLLLVHTSLPTVMPQHNDVWKSFHSQTCFWQEWLNRLVKGLQLQLLFPMNSGKMYIKFITPICIGMDIFIPDLGNVSVLDGMSYHNRKRYSSLQLLVQNQFSLCHVACVLSVWMGRYPQAAHAYI